MLLSVYFCHVSNSVQKGFPSMEKSRCSHRNWSCVSARQKCIFLCPFQDSGTCQSIQCKQWRGTTSHRKQQAHPRKLLCWMQGKEGHLRKSGLKVSNGVSNWLHWWGQSSGFLGVLLRIFPVVFKIKFLLWGLSSSVFFVLTEISVF